MPSVYAHERFGQQVLERLPAPVKELAQTYRTQFGIGLQGPDFLFFHRAWKSNPVAKLGLSIHKASARTLFESFQETLRQKGSQSREVACALGTICHFMLDSACHWYVAEQIEKTGVGHNEIETEFERFLIERDGLDALRFPVWSLIPTDRVTADCLAGLYRGYQVDADTAQTCLKDMRMVKRTLCAPGPLRQKLMRFMMRLTGHYEEIQGHLMALTPNPRCAASSLKLLELADGVIPETVALITEYYDRIETDLPLNKRFDRNFE